MDFFNDVFRNSLQIINYFSVQVEETKFNCRVLRLLKGIVDFAEVWKPLKRRLKPFSGVDSVRVNAGKRNSVGTSWRGVSEMFDCVKKCRLWKVGKEPRESSTRYLIGIDDHIGKYLDISIDSILLIKLINLSGALDSLSTPLRYTERDRRSKRILSIVARTTWDVFKKGNISNMRNDAICCRSEAIFSRLHVLLICLFSE